MEEWLSLEGWGLIAISVCVVCVLTLRTWMMKREEERDGESGVIPRGSWGWPLIGETLQFIASGYTSRPVSFMEKRKSLWENYSSLSLPPSLSLGNLTLPYLGFAAHTHDCDCVSWLFVCVFLFLRSCAVFSFFLD